MCKWTNRARENGMKINLINSTLNSNRKIFNFSSNLCLVLYALIFRFLYFSPSRACDIFIARIDVHFMHQFPIARMWMCITEKEKEEARGFVYFLPFCNVLIKIERKLFSHESMSTGVYLAAVATVTAEFHVNES